MSAVFDNDVDDDSITVTHEPVAPAAVNTTSASSEPVGADLVAAKIKTRSEMIADKFERDAAAAGVEVGFSSLILGELFAIALREGLACLKGDHNANPESAKSTVGDLTEKQKERTLRKYAVRIRKASRHAAHADKSLTKAQRQERIVGSYRKAEAMAQACLDDISGSDDDECCQFCTAVMPSV